MYIGLPNSDLSKEAYTFTNLVIKPIDGIYTLDTSFTCVGFVE